MNHCESLKQDVCETIDSARDRIVEIGEAIMDAPELGFKEYRTADRVKETLDGLGLECEEGLALTGVKAVLRGGKPGPTVALMGELDALQVPGHPRADPETGAAHACGHNAQIAGLMGAAIGLSRSGMAQELAGNVAGFEAAVHLGHLVESEAGDDRNLERAFGQSRKGRAHAALPKVRALHDVT